VQEFLHAFSVPESFEDDPVVCGPPATIFNASGVKDYRAGNRRLHSPAQHPTYPTSLLVP
jgi:hypothetical protein